MPISDRGVQSVWVKTKRAEAWIGDVRPRKGADHQPVVGAAWRLAVHGAVAARVVVDCVAFVPGHLAVAGSGHPFPPYYLSRGRSKPVLSSVEEYWRASARALDAAGVGLQREDEWAGRSCLSQPPGSRV